MEESSDLPSDPSELQVVIEEAESRLASLQEKMAEEASKLERYKVSTLSLSLSLSLSPSQPHTPLHTY